MRKLLFCLILFLISCSGDPNDDPNLDAKFIVIGFVNGVHSGDSHKSTINYSVENIGAGAIESYDVFFKLTQFDGVTTTQTHQSGFIGVGKTRFETVLFLNLSDAVETVTVEDFILR